MPDVNVLAVLVATIVLFVIGSTYYAVFGKQLAEVSEAAAAGEQLPLWKIAVELLRCLIIAAVVTGLASQAEIDEWTGGLPLARNGQREAWRALRGAPALGRGRAMVPPTSSSGGGAIAAAAARAQPRRPRIACWTWEAER